MRAGLCRKHYYQLPPPPPPPPPPEDPPPPLPPLLGDDDKELVAKFIVYGILDYILKPLDYSHLIKRLELIFSKIPDFLPPKEEKQQTENPTEDKKDEDTKKPE